MNNNQKLTLLRAELTRQGLYGFIIPMNDAFQCEYVPECAKRIAFLTGFTGSAGTVVVTVKEAAFFTDGRYTLQAKEQVDSTVYSLFDSSELSPQEWVATHMPAGAIVGFDAWLHTPDNAEAFASSCTKAGAVWQHCTENPVDSIWQDRPAAPQGKVIIHASGFAGESSASKRARLAANLKKNDIDSMLITLPDSICWLLNIRGNDVHCTPFVLCYGLLHQDSTVDLFIDVEKLSEEVRACLGEEVRIFPLDRLSYSINHLKDKKIQCDPSSSALWFFIHLEQAGASIFKAKDSCQLPKACKNKGEQQGAIAAHIRDGVAVVKFLCWLEHALGNEVITELSAAAKLLSFRQQQEYFLYPSFDTIAGFAANGAIVHYHATEQSSRVIENNGLFLLDSGGQYQDGTTDITRVIPIGIASREQITRFTQVLKGHIMLAMAKFPEGTTGSQLDVLARYALWQAGCDYGHGTGHGVGSCLSVHEGPQRISKAFSTVALEPGMIISNEPGYYKTGAYGIRIESLVLVEECTEATHDGKRFLQFKTLTRVPIDRRLIDKTLLSSAEIFWLNAYHQQVYQDLLPYCSLDAELRLWLENSTMLL